MITGKEDLLQALVEAFLMEKGTNIFYKDASARSVVGDVRKTFEELADWEERHMDYIQFLFVSIQGDLDLAGFEAFRAKAPAPMTEAGIPVKELEASIEKYTFSDDKSALDVAMDIEAKAYGLYRRLSDSAADPNAKTVFREMMEQEKKHIEYLKKARGKVA